MSLLDFSLPGSDPTNPNSFVSTPQQTAYQLELARQLMQAGSSGAPVQSPWQGLNRLAQGLIGGYESGHAMASQRLATANATASLGNDPTLRALGYDPTEANIPATPGQTTPALSANDALVDQLSDAQDGSAAPTGGNPALAAALAAHGNGAAPAAPNPMALAAALGAGTPYGMPATPGASAGGAPSGQPPFGSAGAPGGAPDPRNYPVTQAGQAAFIRDYAASKGLDPSLPLGIANAEGLRAISGANPNGASTVDRNPDGSPFSFGAFQLNVRNGLGTEARRAGIDPADPAQANLANKYAIDQMAKGGLAPWRGDAAVNAYQARGGGWTPPALAAINAATGGGAGGAPSSASAFTGSPGAAAGASPAPAGPQGAGAVAGAPAPSQAPGALHPDITALMNVLSDPWATPAQQQIASTLLQARMPTPPTWGVIGKDAITGNEQYGWINPKAMTVTPANYGGAPADGGGALPPLPEGAPAAGAPSSPPAAAGPSGPQAARQASAPTAAGAAPPAPQTVAGAVDLAQANGMTRQGANYLNSLEQQGGSRAVIARQARAIINGQAPLPEATAATKPIDVAVRDAVFRAAPGFNSSLAAARVDTVKSFADKTTPTSAGGMILAANTGLHHLAALADSASQINSTGFMPDGWHALNAVTNSARQYTSGFPAMEAYNINKQALVEELGKMYKGGTPAQSEAEEMAKSLSPNMTPAEQQAVFSKIATLLQGKTVELQRQWQSAFGQNSSYPVIGDEGKAILKRFSNGGQTAPSAPGASAPVSTVRTPADVSKLPSGTRFIIPDGSGRIGVAP